MVVQTEVERNRTSQHWTLNTTKRDVNEIILQNVNIINDVDVSCAKIISKRRRKKIQDFYVIYEMI